MIEYRDPSCFRLLPGVGEAQIFISIDGRETLVRVPCSELIEAFGQTPSDDCLMLAKSRHPWLDNALTRYVGHDPLRRGADGSILLRARDLAA